MIFSLLKKNEKISLLLDIGNGTISAGLVSFVADSKPSLLYLTSIPFTSVEKPNSDKILLSMNTLLDEILTLITKKGTSQSYFKGKEVKISSVLVSFSSPWFISRSRNIHLIQENAFIVTRKFIDNIIDTEKKIAEKELIDSKYEHTFNNEIKIIESLIINTKINGYPIEDSIGKKTKIFDASLYMSFVSKEVLDTVYKQIFKHTHIQQENIHIHTFPLISFTVIRDLFSAVDSFLFIDITSEVTDITLVSNNAIIETVSFPSGRNFIIRQIAKKFSVSNEIAESLLHIYKSRAADEETTLNMQSVISDIEKEWSIYFENAFMELSKEAIPPSYVYIMAESDVTALYNDFIKISKADNTSAYRKEINVVNITENTLSGFYNGNKRFLPNDFIAMLAVFYNKIR